MAIQARFFCTELKSYGPLSPNQLDVVLRACTGEDGFDDEGVAEDGVNSNWSRWTPTGELTMTVMNPAAHDYFQPGQVYNLTLTKHQPQKARAVE